MASSEILSQTLLSITSIKLDQLQKQKDAYESGKRALLDDASYETDNRKRARTLIEGAEKLPTMTPLTTNPMISVANFKRFVHQAQHDPSVSDYFLHDYESALRNELHVQSNKYKYASLYGKLVNEWISLGNPQDGASDSDSGFIPVGREEMHTQRATWEEYVFKPKETDTAAIRSYLDDIFLNSSKDVKIGLESLRKQVKHFQADWDKQTHFDESSLSNCIKGMLRSDVLSDEKRASLRDFLGNTTVLSEIADVLNMRMSTRKTWAWEAPLVIDIRRQINGRYRFFPDEDLLQSIFLHCIGLRWAVELRSHLVNFINLPGVWKSDTQPLSKKDQRRREYFLHSSTQSPTTTLEGKRESHFQLEIFLDQLAASMEEERGSYGDDSVKAEDTRKTHIAVVQKLLHMIETEIIIQTRLNREITVIRSDYKWFGPSIPHSSIFAVLEYFGVDAEWIDLFRRVLEAPLRFKQDPTDAPLQIRKRGTPLSTPLADFFGEMLLFCGDFAVNQKAEGSRLYRLHDDMWLYGATNMCAKGWKALTQFSDVVGLDFNKEKTGSATILRNGSTSRRTPSGLPKGSVTWGFLKLDQETGRFLLDQKEVDKHIEELRLQLNACKTVLDFVQAWNLYGTRFFATNFGSPANCYGRRHIDSMLETFHRIQKALFPDAAGGVGEFFKRMISERSGLSVDDIPDGYLYFPVSLGGLGLKNPFIDLYLIRDQVIEEPDKVMNDFFEQEEAEYRRAKERFEKHEEEPETDVWGDDGGWGTTTRNRADYPDLRDEPFPSFEETVQHRERTSHLLGNAFDRLMEEPSPKNVEVKGVAKAAFKEDEWDGLNSYELWVIQLFHKDMLARFGGLNIVDKGLLPLGMMSMLRQSRFKWQG